MAWNRTKKLIKQIVVTFFLLASVTANGIVYLVGPEMPLERPSQAAAIAEDGDIVEIEAADYVGDVAVWYQNDLVIRGIGGRPHLVADGKSAEGKAIWVIKGNNNVVENIEFSGAKVEDQNGAGIRLEGTNLTVRKCRFYDNENGILTGPNSESEILIEYSEFGNNGYGDGYSHNMYIGRVARFTLQFSYVHNARIGHQVKSRAEENYIMFNRLMDENNGTSSYLIDLPDPGTAFVIGNEMQQGPMAENWALVRSTQKLFLINNTMVNDRGSGIFVNLPGESAGSLLQNNIFVGRGSLGAGDAELRNNLVARSVGLVNRELYDYRLTATSPAIDKGSPPENAGHGSGIPSSEYVHVAADGKREQVGPVDVGAHEYRPQE